VNNKELLLMVESISNEKNISKEDVFKSLEEALEIATKKRNKIDVKIKIDRKSGEITTFRRWLVVEDGENFVDDDGTEFNPELHIYLKDSNGVEIGDFIFEPIENEQFGRIAAQIAKQVIIQKVREAENIVVVDDYSKQLGQVINATVKRVDRGNVYVDIGGVDGIIYKFDLIPNESIRKNDRLRAYIKDVKLTPRKAQIILSRTTPEMMIKLFEMEVPEISEGVIEIMGGSRDPGLRSKLSVKTKDRRIDPIGSCIGMRGARVQAVSNELNGERIDVILWDQDPAQFVINAITPAKVSSIVVDEENKIMDITVEDDQLALAIGRGGQNVKLASRLTGWGLNVISVSESNEKQNVENKKISSKLAKQLDIDSEVANVLINEGFKNIDSVLDADPKTLENIAEFDEKTIVELQERASDAKLVQAMEDAETYKLLMNVQGIDEDLAKALINAEIATIDDLAQLSTYELLDIKKIDNDLASSIIMAARKHEKWFN
jgi:N utilization substance protein A